MNMRKTRLDTATAVVPSLLASDDEFAAPKTHTYALIGSPIDANPAKNAVATHADQTILFNPQPTRIDVLQTGAVTVRISAATLAAAHRVTLFHAESQAAHAVRRCPGVC